MQLADQKQSDRDELEPILYAALINSMVQNFWAIFLGSASAAVAAVMTALKTGDAWLWPLAFLLIAIGTARAFQMRGYENRTRDILKPGVRVSVEYSQDRGKPPDSASIVRVYEEGAP